MRFPSGVLISRLPEGQHREWPLVQTYGRPPKDGLALRGADRLTPDKPLRG